MAGKSTGRLIHPLAIQFNQAILVACLGLAVNVVSALILKDWHHGSHHHYGHEHSHDLNLRSAYVHAIANAVTSLLAIAALLSGKFFGCIGWTPSWDWWAASSSVNGLIRPCARRR
jgi:Co/Zn/Cd efflux system component